MLKRIFCLSVGLIMFFRAIGQSTDSSASSAAPLPYHKFFSIRNGLSNVFDKIGHQRTVTIGFLGGSITYNPGWRPMLHKYFTERFPGTEFHFIDAGIPSLGSLPHAFRLQQDVLDSGKVDLLFVEAAVNDRVNQTDSLTQVRDLEGIVRHAKKSNPDMDIILLEFADPYKNRDYDKGIIPIEIYNHELIANYYGLPSINLAKEVHDKISNHEFSWDKDFKDLHPAMFGQQLYFENIKNLLESCEKQYKANSSGLSGKKLPDPLNKASFSNGSYSDIKNARYKNGWELNHDWMPADSAGAREGFVHVPVLSSTQPGAVLSLPFKGTAVGIAVVSGPDAGIISYSIDREAYRQVDLYTQWSSGLHLPWYLLLGSGIKTGSHILNLKVDRQKNSNSKGNACRIVHFLINE